MRPKGSTRAKKPILHHDFRRLLTLLQKNKTIKQGTKHKLKCAFTLLYVTGCRISEIVLMQKSDIESMIAHNEYSLTNNTKTKTPRLITFSEEKEEQELLRAILPKDDGYLFYKNNSHNPMTKESLQRLCNNFLHVSLGKLYSTHSFRKGYITELHKNGNSLELIRDDVGHKKLATTALYVDITPSEIAKGKSKRKW